MSERKAEGPTNRSESRSLDVKIVIAAWPLRNSNVGIGRYFRDLIEAIGRADERNSYELPMPDSSIDFPTIKISAVVEDGQTRYDDSRREAVALSRLGSESNDLRTSGWRRR